MGWRDRLAVGSASLTPRKERKHGKDDSLQPSYLSGISDISEGVGTSDYPVSRNAASGVEGKPAKASEANPLPETPTVHPPLDSASEAELRMLVGLFSDSEGFSQEDADEALQVALAHPENALTFYRGEVAKLQDPQAEARRQRVLAITAFRDSPLGKSDG